MVVETSSTDVAFDRGGAELLERLLEVACTRTGMEMAWVTQITDDRQEFEVVSAAGSGPVRPGVRVSTARSYCQRVLDGEIPGVIEDTGANAVTRSLEVTAEFGLGSYVGVPIYRANGVVSGTLCVARASPNDSLDAEMVRFLELLAATAAELVPTLPPSLDRRRRTRDRVGRVIRNDSISTVFQPIVDGRSGRIVGHEALSRFPAEPRRPDVWFADAEAVGLGTALELCAARSAIRALSEIPSELFVSINVSPAALESIDLVEEFSAEPDRLVIELTEHRRVVDYPHLRRMVDRLRDMGVLVAVDDAGAGFASFRHVLELVPDIVKVDISICQGVAQDPARQALVRGMVELTKYIGARLIAEGVEQADDARCLDGLGVEWFQGYLFGRPSSVPISSVSNRIA